jgi:hypothetical protein
VIRIDVRPAGETWSTCHTHHALSPRMALDHTYLTRSAHGNISHSCQQHWTESLLSKKGLPSQSTAYGRSIRGSIPRFSPKAAIEAVGVKPTLYWRLATRFTGPITPAYDQYFQYLLTGINSLVLNWHRRELQPRGSRLSTLHSSPFPTDDPLLPPKGPTLS